MNDKKLQGAIADLARMRGRRCANFSPGRVGGTNLHHTCEKKACCNPEHMQLLTIRDHALKHGSFILKAAAASAAKRKAKTYCKWNHEFTEANTWIGKNGGRYCRECNRLHARTRA